jgi:GNAT superfamily N-acetyltransferase
MTDTDPVQLSIDQFTNGWRLMCDASPRRASASLDGVALVFSGLPISFFNVGIVTGRGVSADRLAAAGQAACDWAGPQAVPWLFVTTHEALAPGVDATAALDAVGLAPIMPLTGMFTSGVQPDTREREGLQLTRPGDDAACAVITAINSKAYAMPLDAANDVIGRHEFWRNQFPVVAVADGLPIACAAVMMVSGYRYVALVATAPEQQRRGYAAAAMRRALADAASVHGEQPTVLHATEAGKPVYEGMGYRTIANHTVFMEKRFLTEH